MRNTFFITARNSPKAEDMEDALKKSGFRVVGRATDGAGTLAQLQANIPAVLIVESDLDDITGLQLMAEACRLHPGMRRILLVGPANPDYLKLICDEGVDGMLAYDAGMDSFLACAKAVQEGGCYLHDPLRTALVRRFGPKLFLTSREREVLHLVGQGYVSAQIAKLMGTTPEKVKECRSGIARKLELPETDFKYRQLADEDSFA